MSVFVRALQSLLLTAAANCAVISACLKLTPLAVIALSVTAFLVVLLVNIIPARGQNPAFRLRALKKGHVLLQLFAVNITAAAAVNVAAGLLLVPKAASWWVFGVNIAVCLLVALSLLLNGLSRIFLTSLQLGIKWRILLFLFWWVPGVNIWLLNKVMRMIRNEYEFESVKNELDETRREAEICRTKYPLLLVHGVFFRDSRYFAYWGRIPKALKKNGADIYLGEQQSAASVQDSAAEIAAKIGQIVSETGCEKLNIIAHSKGGLDARFAISRLGMDQYVASLTTVNTPHRGCLFADKLLEKAPDKLKNGIARKYNAALRKLGDKNPDFLAAVADLTATRCRKFNEEVPDRDGVFYQSVASKMRRWTSGKFPLNMSHILVLPFDGENDGLVSIESARWGDSCRVLTPPGSRGISHGDMIDLNRENIDGFDVRELYVDIVRDLKAMAL